MPETEVDEFRVAFRDFIRRIGLRRRRSRQLEPGGRRAQAARRQPSDTTVAMGSISSADRPAATADSVPARLSEESASEKRTVIARRAPAQASEAPQPPPMAEAAPGREVSRTDRDATLRQPVAGGGVDPLTATRVVPAAGEQPLGQVLGVLVAVDGELEGVIRPIQSGSNRLGRHPDCEVFLPSEWISREHARVEYRHGIFTIEASSDKPTLVNSERITGSELRDGDCIKLGKTTLRFRSIL